MRWRNDQTLEIDVDYPSSVRRSLSKARGVNVVYVASASQAFRRHGTEYEKFTSWASKNAENGAVLAKAPCSKYVGSLLKKAC